MTEQKPAVTMREELWVDRTRLIATECDVGNILGMTKYYRSDLHDKLTARIAVLEEALRFYADGDFVLLHENKFLEWGDRNIDLQGTNILGTKAKQALDGVEE